MQGRERPDLAGFEMNVQDGMGSQDRRQAERAIEITHLVREREIHCHSQVFIIYVRMDDPLAERFFVTVGPLSKYTPFCLDEDGQVSPFDRLRHCADMLKIPVLMLEGLIAGWMPERATPTPRR